MAGQGLAELSDLEITKMRDAFVQKVGEFSSREATEFAEIKEEIASRIADIKIDMEVPGCGQC